MTTWTPDGLILALQFWRGDEAAAIRLARLLADIETARRSDCALYFCCDKNTQLGPKLLKAMQSCGEKFPIGCVQLDVAGDGYPDGPNVLWAGIMEHFYREWSTGKNHLESVFTFEADGAPLRSDWIAQLMEAHRRTIDAGKLVTGDIRHRSAACPHPNGNLIAHVSVIRNFPELTETPKDRPWDMFHHATLRSIARHDSVIRSEHRSRRWTRDSLESVATETAWLHGCRDDSAYDFALELRT